MLFNLFLLLLGLCLTKLLKIIEVGAKPPTLLNRQILAQVGAANSLEAFAVVQNDLIIAQAFTDMIFEDYMSGDVQQNSAGAMYTF